MLWWALNWSIQPSKQTKFACPSNVASCLTFVISIGPLMVCSDFFAVYTILASLSTSSLFSFHIRLTFFPLCSELPKIFFFQIEHIVKFTIPNSRQISDFFLPTIQYINNVNFIFQKNNFSFTDAIKFNISYSRHMRSEKQTDNVAARCHLIPSLSPHYRF